MHAEAAALHPQAGAGLSSREASGLRVPMVEDVGVGFDPKPSKPLRANAQSPFKLLLRPLIAQVRSLSRRLGERGLFRAVTDVGLKLGAAVLSGARDQALASQGQGDATRTCKCATCWVLDV